jgi:hypothetical protein
MPGVDPALQDAGTGRGALAGNLGKLNSKAPGAFDYTRICNNGKEEGASDCPSGAPLGDRPSEWGCTRDNVTGLIWRVVDFTGRYTFSDALGQRMEGWCGRDATTWRIPSIDQFQSVFFNAGEKVGVDTVAAQAAWLPMLNYSRRNQLEGVGADSMAVVRTGFWSSTQVSDNIGSTEAWGILLGGNGRTEYIATNFQLRIAPVSTADLSTRFADPYYAGARWVANLSAGTLLDRRSGLVWMMCSIGYNFNSGTGRCDRVAGQPTERNLRDALLETVAVNGDASRNLGFSDWRVPNRAELASLLDCVRWRPSQGGADGCTEADLKKMVDIDNLTRESALSYWTSSWVPSTLLPGGEAFTANFKDGMVGLEAELNQAFRVRLVRHAR